MKWFKNKNPIFYYIMSTATALAAVLLLLCVVFFTKPVTDIQAGTSGSDPATVQGEPAQSETGDAVSQEPSGESAFLPETTDAAETDTRPAWEILAESSEAVTDEELFGETDSPDVIQGSLLEDTTKDASDQDSYILISPDGYTLVTSTVDVNIRQRPSIESPIIGVLGEGSSILRDQNVDGWSRVFFGDRAAYISSDYLVPVARLYVDN